MILFRITLHPSGGQFTAAQGQPIVHAALAAGMRIPSGCRNGTCRICRCRLLAGSAQHTIDWPGLSADEKAEGWILPCVACVTSDAVLHVDSVESLPAPPPAGK